MAFFGDGAAADGTGLSWILKLVRTTGGTKFSPDIFREERGHPAVAAEEHLAGASSLVTAPREVVAPQAVGDVVVLEPLALRIDRDDYPSCC